MNRYLVGTVVLSARPARGPYLVGEDITTAATAKVWQDSQDKAKAKAAGSSSDSSIDLGSIATAGGAVILALIAWPFVSKLLK